MNQDKYKVIWRETGSKEILWSRIFETKNDIINYYKKGLCLGVGYELIVEHNNKECNLFQFIKQYG